MSTSDIGNYHLRAEQEARERIVREQMAVETLQAGAYGKNAALIRANAAHGMSRQRMVQIWGRQAVDYALSGA